MRRVAAFAFTCLFLIASHGAASTQAITANSIRVTWTAVGDDSLLGTATTYDIRYSTTPITTSNWNAAAQASGEPVPAVAGTQQSFTVTGLLPVTSYYFAIKVADEAPNWSGLSNVVSGVTLAVPDTTRPAPIANLGVSSVTGGSATLAWTAVGDDSLTGTATSYDLRYSTSPINAGNWSSATQVAGEPSPAAPGTSQSTTVSGLANQTTYYFALRVTDDAGNTSALSNVPTGTTLDVVRPAAVNNLSVGWIWLNGTGGTTDERKRAVIVSSFRKTASH